MASLSPAAIRSISVWSEVVCPERRPSVQNALRDIDPNVLLCRHVLPPHMRCEAPQSAPLHATAAKLEAYPKDERAGANPTAQEDFFDD
jgi:hypothetical protein